MSEITGYISTPFHGEAGESAYEIAKKYGYTGTEAEWVKSLGFIPDGTIGKEKLANDTLASVYSCGAQKTPKFIVSGYKFTETGSKLDEEHRLLSYPVADVQYIKTQYGYQLREEASDKAVLTQVLGEFEGFVFAAEGANYVVVDTLVDDEESGVFEVVSNITENADNIAKNAEDIDQNTKSINENAAFVEKGFFSNGGVLKETLTGFDFYTNAYVNKNGVVTATAGAEWCYSSPMAVKKNTTVRFVASGYSVNIAMISLADAEGNIIKPVVICSPGENGEAQIVKEYTYNVEEDGYIVLSFRSNYKHELYINEPDRISQVAFELEQTKKNNIYNTKSLIKMFKKVICIGDSYTKGYLSKSDKTATRDYPNYSWVEYVGKKTGNTWINRGVSGANAKTWFENANGYAAVASDGKAQAYIIGLGINDSSSTTRGLAVGTAEDIGTDTESYYGCLSKIVVKVAEISPDAHIFINTCPLFYDFDRVEPYNEAIRDIVNYYKDTYNVHCVDLAVDYYDLYFNPDYTVQFVQNHPTAIGHLMTSEMYMYALSDYISRNHERFTDVPWIEYDE